MGLSVSLYTDITKCTQDEGDFTAFVIDPEWENRISLLEAGEHYRGKEVARVVDYSYSTHMTFRRYLLVLSGRSNLINKSNQCILWNLCSPSMDFYELIYFADNAGCFDWATAKELLADFDKYESVNAASDTSSPMRESYFAWHEALRTAVNNQGVFVFH